MPKVFICVSGNIGSGKTTVANIIANIFDFKKFEESVEDNPYLNLFYQDMNKWAYRLQRYFLLTRALAHEKVNVMNESVVQDRSIYEDMAVFAENQRLTGLWTEQEYKKYKELYDMVSAEVKPPDLLIYLRTSMPFLKERIKSRNRSYEMELIKEGNTYLEQLQSLYETWVKNYNFGSKLIIETDKLNIINNPDDLVKLINMIKFAISRGDNEKS
ncbi:MAG: deoxynucleoside kinase [Candidatus Aenigmatarchaeota archaeon]